MNLRQISLTFAGVVVLLVCVIVALPKEEMTTSERRSSSTSSTWDSEEAKARKLKSEWREVEPWRYSKTTDEMTGAVTQRACIFSAPFSNADEARGELCAVKGSDGADFRLGNVEHIELNPVTEGDPQVGNFRYIHDDCSIRMRVDDKAGYAVCGRHPGIYDYNLVHLYDDTHPPVTAFKTGKIIRIELKVGIHGPRIFTFKPDKPLDSTW